MNLVESDYGRLGDSGTAIPVLNLTTIIKFSKLTIHAIPRAMFTALFDLRAPLSLSTQTPAFDYEDSICEIDWDSTCYHRQAISVFRSSNLTPDVMAFSGDRHFLACGARNGDINLFALHLSRHIHSFRVHEGVSALSWNDCTGDERTVFIGMKDGSVEGYTFIKWEEQIPVQNQGQRITKREFEDV
ncbi:hypothetical protein B0H13DRAFT_1867024 [Mycena leptocephala]|nr:hypothetical protein B0H13DRAFT_1867024 [Mycena leptocephala]